jgi:hypothetical protein
MKNYTMIIAAGALMASCQKEDLCPVTQQEQQESKQFTESYGEWLTSTMYNAGLDLEQLEGEVCSPNLSVETQVNIRRIEIDGNTLITTDVNGVTEIKSFDYHESYLVPSAGGSEYSVEALRINNGEGGAEEYELLFDYCGGDRLTFYNTVTGRMILTTRI